MHEIFIPYPMLMQPYLSPRPWGGEKLSELLEKETPGQGGPFGEAWELSDHPDGRSHVANGIYQGWEFGKLARTFAAALFNTRREIERFPLLIKYIDAAQDLSIQVHPSDRSAPPGERGKTECWFVMHAEPGAVMIHGLQAGVDEAALRRACAEGTVESCVRRVPIFTGDFVYIPAGTVHATMAGSLLCEVQQSSNTTYRFYDWNRQPARELHIEQALAVTNFKADPADPGRFSVNDLSREIWHRLVRNEFFEVRTATWAPGQHIESLISNEHGLIVNVVAGEGTLKIDDHPVEDLKTGQTWFLPAGMAQWDLTCGDVGLRLVVSESLEF